ncbi:MAG: Xaa-Pro peptidase family protein [Pseudonocardiales bacterium]
MLRPGFPAAEYEARVSRFQTRLSDRGLGGAILTSEANFSYFTGYHSFAPGSTYCRSVFAFIPTVGAPVLLVHAFPEADARRDCWFDDVRSYDDLSFAPVAQVASIAAALGIRDAGVGMELGAEHRIGLTGNEFDEVRHALRPSPITDVGDILWDLRLIKSEAEIALLVESGRIAAVAFEETYANLRIGMTELDVAAALGQKIAAEGGRVGFFVVTSGAGSYDRTAGHPRDRALEPGDMLWVDLGVVHGGYWTDHCRAAVIGRASDGQRDSWNAIRDVTWSAVQRCLPGQTPPDIVAGLEADAAERGLHFTFAAGRAGHGIGLMSTEPPHIARYDTTVLREGMAITIEPGWVDQQLGTFVAEENLVIRSGAPQLLTVTQRELVEITAGPGT